MSIEKPLVSVDMITYNHEKFIAQAIEGVLMQKTDFPFELIIGEDCSTDRTREIVVDYANRYPDIIKPILHEKNVGMTANVRATREASSGKYVAICEGDDYWIDPLKLQKQVDFMENHPDFSMCCHAVLRVNVEGRDLKKPIMPYPEDCIVPTEDIIVAGGGFVGTNSILYRKEFMDNPPALYYLSSVAGDFKLLLILALAGRVFYFNHKMSVYRVNTPSGWSAKMASSRNSRLKYYKDKISFLREFNKSTKNKYENSIEQAITKNEVYMLIDSGQFNKLKSEKYSRYYRSLGTRFILKQRLKHTFPRTFKLYKMVFTPRHSR